MIPFFQGDPKQRLQALIEKAREKHEKNLQRENMASKKKQYQALKEQIIVLSRLGKFSESQALIHEQALQCSEKEIQQLFSLAKKEEIGFLTKNFLQLCKQGEKEKAQALLADIHTRSSDEDFSYYQALFEQPELIGTWKAQWLFWRKQYLKFKNHFRSLRPVSFPSLPLSSKEEKQVTEADSFDRTEKILEKVEQLQSQDIQLPEENVNDFESIFGDVPQDEKDILESILEKRESAVPEEGNSASFVLSEENEPEEVEYINPFLSYLPWLERLTMISVFFLLASWAFFFIQLDPLNRVLGYLNQENLAVQHVKAQEQMKSLEKEIKQADARLKILQEGILDMPAKIAIQEIQLKKNDWMGLREDLHQATLNAFPYNDVLKYIQYTSFQGNAEKASIVISGTITDPSGRVFMLVTKLMDAINEHPSFSGADMKTFTKNKASGEDVKGFSTNFSLTLQYHNQTKTQTTPETPLSSSS